MSAQVAADTEKYTIEVDDDIDAIVHTWDAFAAGQEFRDGCNELLDVIRWNGKSKLLVDTSGIQAHDEADKEWLQEEWIPETIETGIEYSVSVTGDSVISEMEMEEFVDQAQDLDYTYVLAGDMGEAREWIAEQ
ncbi:hypothetical protein [Halosimplex salinum]|uniref:hypothetical protein n=1 Tax=Halosimplex salinum TaxID=1710538 RepID=UPI000F4889AD|nr:hypothetical protein [Halosimplex salinum]